MVRLRLVPAILLGVWLSLVGCGDQRPAQEQAGPAPPPHVLPVISAEPPADYSTAEWVQRGLQARDLSDWKALRVAINVFQSEEGRFPPRLEDLPVVRERGIDTSRWAYDPATGKVRWHQP